MKKARGPFAAAVIRTDQFLKSMLLDGDKKTNEQLAELVAIKAMLSSKEIDEELLKILVLKYNVDIEALAKLVYNS